MLCFPRGDARKKRLSLYAGFSHRETGLRPAAAEPAEPILISQRMLCFCRGFGLARTALGRCFLSKALVASGKKSCGRAGASWALLSRAPSSHPGFILPSRNKQTQPRPYSCVHALGWHSAHNAISRRRQGLPFCSVVQGDRGLGPCLTHP